MSHGPASREALRSPWLFVYGTLRPGEERWAFLAPFVADDGHPDAVPGWLYDTGCGYPAARFDPGAGSWVHGHTFPLRSSDAARAVEVLDEVEGAVRGLYRRTLVSTREGRTAMAYEYGDGLELTPIASGDWLRWSRADDAARGSRSGVVGSQP